MPFEAIAAEDKRKSGRPVKGAGYLLFISAATLFLQAAVLSDQGAYMAMIGLIGRHQDIFVNLFNSLLAFSFVYTVSVILLVARMGKMERTLALAVCIVAVGNTLVSFALLYGGTGLIRAGQVVTPSAGDAFFFSTMVFCGNGWEPYHPNDSNYYAVVAQALASYIFMPILFSAVMLILDSFRSGTTSQSDVPSSRA
ncbi:MAG TPA: hypothetical protein VHM92_04965 [Allosphingosinicella sp.]|nr:hypothetical protein [Allosphingosinicella sp.]